MTGTIVVGSSLGRRGRARATARSAADVGAPPCLVVDLDGSYVPYGREQVVALADVVDRAGLRHQAARAVATLEPDDLELYLGAVGAEYALAHGFSRALVLRAGAHVLRDPAELLSTPWGLMVVPGTDAAGALRRASTEQPVDRPIGRTGRTTQVGPGAGPLASRAFFVVGSFGDAVVLRDLAADWRLAGDALDLAALEVGASVVTDLLMVGAWRTVPLGAAPYVVDLSGLDPARPWLLDAWSTSTPLVLLSEHPDLAALVATEAQVRLADRQPDQVLQIGASGDHRLEPALRAEARRADATNTPLPDVLGVGEGPAVEEWALELVPAGARHQVARYLAAVRLGRPDLQTAFRRVPGPDAKALAGWATQNGVDEAGYDADLLRRAAAATLAARPRAGRSAGGPLSDGVNLVGYLSGELGLGTSARLVDQALQAAGVPTSTDDVSRTIESRQGATYRRSEPVSRRTTLLCVNAGETAGVAAERVKLLRRTRVIGMWYWELEDFPASQHGGFAHVDEVWAATDFMRAAIARHAGDVPVRTVTPPLPQAGDDPGRLPERFGIPTDRPWFLFTFDFLSYAERKNPLGLVEAFSRAFGDRPVHERPTLVIKTINADRHPGDAERLRLRVAGREDVRFLDTYLGDHERHVLVAHCTAYVSLHRAEGLGLTVAEAMAWGRPVITTNYGGVTQFCNDENAFLVDWTATRITETVGPYEKGLTWAEPDVEHAASLMRLVVAEPTRAAAVGERAARDIRERHSPRVAGVRMREVLLQGDQEWAARRTDQEHAEVADQRAGEGGLLDRLRSAAKTRRGRD